MYIFFCLSQEQRRLFYSVLYKVWISLYFNMSLLQLFLIFVHSVGITDLDQYLILALCNHLD